MEKVLEVNVDIRSALVRFVGKGVELPVSIDMMGRIFGGLGHPIDGARRSSRRRW